MSPAARSPSKIPSLVPPAPAANGRRTRIISIGGGKGGVGKSIVSCNLAVAMAQLGNRVVLADLDLGTANQHLLLGVDTPNQGIEALMGPSAKSGKGLEDPRAGLTETKFKDLFLLAGSGATLGAANITYNEKIRLIRRLRMLDADVVVIDVGAGVGYNALDFFELGAQRLVVTTPQVTSIHDAYSFLKGTVLRTLHHHSKGKKETELLKGANQSDESEKVVDILAGIRKTNPDFADRVFNILRNYGSYLIANQITDSKQLGIFHAVSKMMHDYLGISVPILGWLKHTEQVANSVNNRMPLVVAGTSENARTLREMAQTLLVEEVVLEEELLVDNDEVAVEDEATAADDETPPHLTPASLRVEELTTRSAPTSLRAIDSALAEQARGAEAAAPAPAKPPVPRPPAIPVSVGAPRPAPPPAPGDNDAYLGAGRARVYQPPPRNKKKRPVKKVQEGGRRRSITLPGMTPSGAK